MSLSPTSRPEPHEPRLLAGVTVFAVLAHPDDEALACGGTLARVAELGGRVVLVCASRGELGSLSDPRLAPDGDLGAVRERELRDSAAVLGAAEVVLLGHPDGCLRWVDGLADELAALFASRRPDAVITFDVDGLYWHPDHVGMHEATTRAVAMLGEGAPALYYVAMPAGAMRGLTSAAHALGAAHPDQGLWGVSPDAFGVAAPPPSFSVDVRGQAERKLRALRCHRTQAGPTSPFQWAGADDLRRWLGLEPFRRAPLPTRGPDVLERLAEGYRA